MQKILIVEDDVDIQDILKNHLVDALRQIRCFQELAENLIIKYNNY